MKQILRYLKPYLGKLLAATVLIALSTLCDLLLPTWMSAILNGGIAARDFPAIAVRCLQMLAIAAVSLASILGGTRLSTEVVACFCADLRADVFRKVNTLSFEEFGSLGTAALVTRATHDVDTVSWVASMLSGTVATIPMLFLGGVVLAMRKDVVLSLVLLAFVPLLTLIVVLLGKRVLPLWGKSDDYIDVQNALLRERLRGIRVIRAFNTEKREHGRIADATHIMAENIIRANVSMGLLTPLATLFLNISALLIIYLGGWRMVHGVSGVSAGDIFAIIQYVTMVMNGVIMASFAIIMYPRAQVAAGRIHQVLGAEGMGDPMAGETAELHGEIELQDVSFSYGGSADAISHVSLHILPGQRISIIGGTGSGKSTLMHLLLGFRAPTQGRILLTGAMPPGSASTPCAAASAASCRARPSTPAPSARTSAWATPMRMMPPSRRLHASPSFRTSSPRARAACPTRSGRRAKTSPVARSSALPSRVPSSRTRPSTFLTTASPRWTS